MRIQNYTEQDIVNDYKAGIGVVALTKKYFVFDRKVDRILKKHKIKKRSKSEAVRSCALDEKVFDTLTKKSMYWIGFLAADGHMGPAKNQRSGRLSLRLAEKDKGHVEKFKRFLKSSHKITYCKPAKPHYHPDRKHDLIKGGPSYSVCIASNRYIDNLKRYGLENGVPRKVIQPLAESIDFWRGVVDGDGYCGLKKYLATKIYFVYPVINIVGNKELLDQFVEFIKSHCPKFKGRSVKACNIWSVRVSGRMGWKIIKLLYGNSPIESLDRKQKIANEILNNPAFIAKYEKP